MLSDKAQMVPFTVADVVRKTIDRAVRHHRPDLNLGQYLYVAEGVFSLLCEDTEDALLTQPVERWTPTLSDPDFINKVGDYLTKLEIKTGRMVLYGEENGI